MKKKLTPILSAVLVLLALLLGIPGILDTNVPEPSDDPTTVLTDSGSPEAQLDTNVPDPSDDPTTVPTDDGSPEAQLDIDGTYTTKEDVALYIHLYQQLPQNFMTKSEARELGWEGGGLEDHAPGMCIGGDRFGNYEGLLPEAEGRYYTECDIDTLGKDSRGAKRIVFSNDGLIYYTDDHYETFELMYGEP